MEKSKYVVRDSAIQTYLGKHGSVYNNSVVWYRSIFKDEQKISTERMQRDLATPEEAQAFSHMLYMHFQIPAFKELEQPVEEAA